MKYAKLGCPTKNRAELMEFCELAHKLDNTPFFGLTGADEHEVNWTLDRIATELGGANKERLITYYKLYILTKSMQQ